jgi:hypothetical protein
LDPNEEKDTYGLAFEVYQRKIGYDDENIDDLHKESISFVQPVISRYENKKCREKNNESF